MSVKKFATEVWQQVMANSITYAISTAVALGLPYWATIKEQLSWPLAASLAIVLFAATITIIRVLSSREKYSDTARLSLQTYGDARVPRGLHHENVYRWYQLKNVLHATDPATGQVHDSTVATTIFLAFETPVLVHTLEVQSPDIRLPAYEVKEFNNRFAIIVFAGEVPMGTLEIVVHT
jgi:hypothetical protein